MAETETLAQLVCASVYPVARASAWLWYKVYKPLPAGKKVVAGVGRSVDAHPGRNVMFMASHNPVAHVVRPGLTEMLTTVNTVVDGVVDESIAAEYAAAHSALSAVALASDTWAPENESRYW